GNHIDGADQFAVMIVGQERPGRQRFTIDEELAQTGDEIRQGSQFADLLIWRCRWRFRDGAGCVLSRGHRDSAEQRCGGEQAYFLHCLPSRIERPLCRASPIGWNWARKVPGLRTALRTGYPPTAV